MLKRLFILFILMFTVSSCLVDYIIASAFRVNKDPAAFKFIDTSKVYKRISIISTQYDIGPMTQTTYLRFFANGRYGEYVEDDSANDNTIQQVYKRENGPFRFENNRMILQYSFKELNAGGTGYAKKILTKTGEDTLQIRGGHYIETYRGIKISDNVIRFPSR